MVSIHDLRTYVQMYIFLTTVLRMCSRNTTEVHVSQQVNLEREE